MIVVPVFFHLKLDFRFLFRTCGVVFKLLFFHNLGIVFILSNYVYFKSTLSTVKHYYFNIVILMRKNLPIPINSLCLRNKIMDIQIDIENPKRLFRMRIINLFYQLIVLRF